MVADDTPMSLDDEDLWVEEARHDAEAFRRLYARLFDGVYAYVSYRVGRVQDTEDLVAETFLRVAEGIGRFEWRHEGSFSAWTFRIAHNLVANFHRRNRRREEPLPLHELPEIPGNTPLPDDILVRKESFDQLRRLILELPPRQQEVITLRFFGGLRNREIAEVLRLDDRTVASHLCRGLEELRRKYADNPSGAKGSRGR